jgi:hypothetical protein
MLNMMGLGQITSLEAWTLFLAASAIALLTGWVIDMVAERTGFGVFINAVICIIALCVALVTFRRYIGEVSPERLPMIIGTATISVMVHMFGLIFIRRVLRL